MFNDLLKWLFRTCLLGIFWVFFLSIHVEGRTLFSYANETLVENQLVRTADEELMSLWRKLYHAASLAFAPESDMSSQQGISL